MPIPDPEVTKRFDPAPSNTVAIDPTVDNAVNQSVDAPFAPGKAAGVDFAFLGVSQRQEVSPMERPGYTVQDVTDMIQGVKSPGADLPSPRTTNDAMKMVHRDFSRSVRFHPGIARNIEALANAWALDFGTRIGMGDQLRPDTFVKLRDAYRGLATLAYSPFSPDEHKNVVKQFGSDLSRKAQEITMAELQALEQPASKEIVFTETRAIVPETQAHREKRKFQLQQEFAYWKGVESRLDDPGVQSALTNFLDSQIREDRRKFTEDPAVKAQLNMRTSLINEGDYNQSELPRVEGAQVDFQVENVGMRNERINERNSLEHLDVHFRRVFRRPTQGNQQLPHSEILGTMWDRATWRSRKRQLGIPEEALDATDIVGALAVTHPTLTLETAKEVEAHRALLAAKQRNLGDSALRAWAERNAPNDVASRIMYAVTSGSVRENDRFLKLIAPSAFVLGRHADVGELSLEAAASVKGMFTAGMEMANELTRFSAPGVRITDTQRLPSDRVPTVGGVPTSAINGVIDSLDAGVSFFAKGPAPGDMDRLREQLVTGRVDPGLLLRVTASHDDGIVTRLNILAGATFGQQGLIDRLAPVAAAAPGAVNPALIASTMNEEKFKAAQRTAESLKDTFLATREELEAIDEQVARDMRFGGLKDQAGALFQSIWTRLTVGVADTIEGVMTRPGDLAAGGAVGGFVLGPVVKHGLLKPVRGFLDSTARIAKTRKMGGFLSDLAHMSPESAVEMRGKLREMDWASFTGRSKEGAVDSVNAALDAIIQEQQTVAAKGVTDMGRFLKNPELQKRAADMRRGLIAMGETNLRAVLDHFEMPKRVTSMIDGMTENALFSTVADSLSRKLGFSRKKLNAAIVEKSRNIAQELNGLVERAGAEALDNPEAQDIAASALRGDLTANQVAQAAGEIPLSVGASLPTEGIGRKVTNAWSKFWGEDPKSLPGRAGKIIDEMFSFATEKIKLAAEWKRVNAGQRAHQIGIMRHMDSKMSHEFDYLTGKRRALGRQLDETDGTLSRLEPEATAERELLEAHRAEVLEELAPIDARLAKVATVRNKSRNALTLLEEKAWDQEVSLARLQDVADEITLHDMDTYLRTRTGMATPEEYAMRMTSHTGDKFDAWAADFRKYLADPDAPGAENFIGNARRAFLREFGKSPGLSELSVDVGEGGAVLYGNQAVRRRLARKRAYVETVKKHGADSDRVRELEFTPENDYGMPHMSISDDLRSVRAWAHRFETVKRRGALARFQDLSGPVEWAIWGARDAELDLRAELAYNQFQLTRFMDRFNSMPDDQQRAFRRAMVETARNGGTELLEAWKKERPDLFEGTNDPDVNTLRLLEDVESFRGHLLRDAARTGFIDPKLAEAFADPYVSHLFEAHEIPDLLQVHTPDLDPTKSTVDLFPGAMGLNELKPQRDPFHATVMVHSPNGQVIRKTLKGVSDLKTAQQWVQDNYGFKKSETGAGFLRGKGSLGDSILITEPTGAKKFFKDLRAIAPEKALFARVSQLMRDVVAHDVFSMFDRPGWAFTRAEWKNFRAGNQGFNAKLYVELPDTAGFGPLRGKFVPKAVGRELFNYFDGMKVFDNVTNALKEVQLDFGMSSTGNPMAKVLYNATDWTGKALRNNLIARNLQTLVGNVLMDRELFARMADPTGSYLYSKVGRESRGLAAKILFSDNDGKITLTGRQRTKFTPEEQVYVDAAIREGMFGDTLLGAVESNEVRRELVNFLLGDPADAIEVMPPALRNFGRRWAADTMKFLKVDKLTGRDVVKSFLDATEDPQVAALQKRLDAAETRLREVDGTDSYEAVWRERESLVHALKQLDIKNIGKRASLGRLASWLIHGRTAPKGAAGVAGLGAGLSKTLYQRASNQHRIGLFIHLMKNGYDAKAAGDIVRTGMQNYAGVPRAVQQLSRNAMGAAITSFPAEMARITKFWLTERPFTYLGILGAVSATNMVNLVASGVDPYSFAAMAPEMSGGSSVFEMMTSSLILPTGERGKLSTLSVPAVNPHLLFRSPFGVLGNVVNRRAFEDTAFGNLMYGGSAVLSKFFFGQPLTNAAAAVLTKSDPITGRPLESRSAAFGKAATSMSGMFVPPQTPFVGANAHQIRDMTYRPPNFRTGRNVTDFEAALQVFLGVRARGGFFDKTAQNLGLEGALDTMSSAITRIAAGGQDPRKPFGLDPKGFDEDSILNSFLWQSKKVDPEDPTKADIAISEDFQQVRLGVTALEQARERGDDAMAKWAKRQIRTGLEEMKRKRKRLVKLGGQEIDVAEWGDNPLEWTREQINTIVGAYKAMDMSSAFDEISPSRQADIIRNVSRLATFNTDRIRQLILRASISRAENFRGGNPERIARAIQMTQDTLQELPIGGMWQERRRLLTGYLSALQVRFQRTMIQDATRRVKDARQRQAGQLLQEVYK